MEIRLKLCIEIGIKSLVIKDNGMIEFPESQDFTLEELNIITDEAKNFVEYLNLRKEISEKNNKTS